MANDAASRSTKALDTGTGLLELLVIKFLVKGVAVAEMSRRKGRVVGAQSCTSPARVDDTTPRTSDLSSELLVRVKSRIPRVKVDHDICIGH